MTRLLTWCVVVAFAVPSHIHAQQGNPPPNVIGETSGDQTSEDGSNVDEQTTKRWRRFSRVRLEKMLSSPKEQVRERAVLDINRLYWDHPEVPELLISAITNALATEEPPASTLSMIKTLTRFQTPRVERMLLSWLEDELKKPQASNASFELLSALRAFDDDQVHQALQPLLNHSDPRLVMLAADVLSQHEYQGAYEPIQSLAGHEAFARRYGFRACVFEAVSHYKHPDTVGFYVNQLPAIDGQLKYFAVDRLTRATGQSLGGDAEAWKSWWDAARERYRFPDKLSPPSTTYTWDYPLPVFFANPIYAKRVVFVIDISSTMAQRVGGLETRLDRAKKELAAAINRLPPDAFFSIIAFDREVRPLSRTFVPAVPPQKVLAIQAATNLQNGRGTNLFDGLWSGLTIGDNIEALYLLSDGLPSVGVTAPATILEAITRENQFRRTSIHCIAVGRDSPLLRDLANFNGGTYRRSF